MNMLEKSTPNVEFQEMIQDMIRKHMWPLTIFPPKSLEGFILTIIDKYCTVCEFFK